MNGRGLDPTVPDPRRRSLGGSAPRRGRLRPTLAVPVLALAALVVGCTDLLVEPARPPAHGLAFTILPVVASSPPETAASLNAAFDKADQVRVRIGRGGVSVLDTIIDFTPGESETRIRIEFDLEDLRETVDVQVQLRAEGQPIFEGGAQVSVEAGITTEARIPIEPIPAAVRVPESVPDLESIGESAQLTGEVLFATGDPIPGLTLTWSTLDPEIVAVTTGGQVTALAEGSARLVGAFGAFSGTVTIAVRQRVAVVRVDPAVLTLAVGQTHPLTAMLEDARENTITGRPVDWTSSAPAVVTVDADGLVRAVTPGEATIQATSEGVSGQAQLTVIGRAPTAVTDSTSAVSGNGATLHGTVNPNGEMTQAWFEWGPTADLGTTTSPQPMGNGTTDATLSAALTGLQPATTYFYRVAAENARGTAAGDIQQFRTIQVPPAAPSDLTAAAVSISQIDLSWTDNSTNEDGFRIERCTGPECTVFTEIAAVPANTTSFQDAGLAAATTYRYRVRAYNETGTSPYSNVAMATTSRTIPAAPSGLSATAVTSTRIDLSWTDNSNTEDGFRVERCTGAECMNFAEIATVPANATSFQDPELAGGTTYAYRVRAYNESGNSGYSNLASATTPRGQLLVISTWRMEQNLDDSSGPNHGEAIGGEPTFVPGVEGEYALLLEPERAYMEAGVAEVGDAQAFSVGLWVYPLVMPTETQRHHLVAMADDRATKLLLLWRDDPEVGTSITVTAAVETSFSPYEMELDVPSAETGFVSRCWNRLVVTFDSQVLRLYVNGGFAGSIEKPEDQPEEEWFLLGSVALDAGRIRVGDPVFMPWARIDYLEADARAWTAGEIAQWEGPLGGDEEPCDGEPT
jgi:hypothetical protein